MISARSSVVIAGLTVLAAGILVAVDWQTGEPMVRSQAAEAEDLHSQSAPKTETPRSDTQDAAPPSRAEILATPVEASAGSFWLRIGDEVAFGGEIVSRQSSQAGSFDFYCQDIRHGVSLHCPEGALSAHSPLSSAGMPSTAASAAELLTDAPPDLPKRNLMLTEKPSLQDPGLGFVKARDGKVYRLHLEELKGHPDALLRQALVRFHELPQVDGGGLLRLPSIDGQLAPNASTHLLLLRALALGRFIPGESFSSDLAGKDHSTVSALDGDITINRQHLIVKEPLNAKVAVNQGSLILEEGIEKDASVAVSGSGLAVGGDVHGTITTPGRGFMYIQGNLYGNMSYDRYTTGIIDGDLYGTLRLRSYSDVLVRGRLLGKLDIKGSCWSTLYLGSFISRQELVEMQGNFSQITLHLAVSDLPPGEHKGVGSWRSVIVGDPIWAKFPR